jgi:hypothetical protein
VGEGVWLGGRSVDKGGDGPGHTGLIAGPSAPVPVGHMAGDSDMEISDDDLPPPSSVGSCLPTRPPTHQEAHDFLSSLLLAPGGEGVLPGDGPVDGVGAGVCPGARPVDSAVGSLVAMNPDAVNPLLATPPLSACQKRGRRRSNKRRAQREALLSLEAPVPTPQEDLSGAHVPLESGSHLTPPIPTPLHDTGVWGVGCGVWG